MLNHALGWVLGPQRSPLDPTDLSLLPARVFTGLTMALFYGAGKFPPPQDFIDEVGTQLGFPMPTFFAWSAGAAEFLGGFALAAGLATRVSAFFLLITMVVAAYVANAGEPLRENMLAHLFGLFMLVFLIRGGGALSADGVLHRLLGGKPSGLMRPVAQTA